MNKDIDYKKDLAEKLDELKKIEGFPIGTDEDILALSQPPYYTACPNPYIKDFIEEYGKPYDEETDNYHREPFVGDVSEGKNDPIYNAHSYHTKVPHKAIMKYIEHYTDEGDIVLDGFCGTGMTGVAAQLLNRKAILSDLSPIATFIAYNYNTSKNEIEFKQEAFNVLEEASKECNWMYETIHSVNNKPAQTKGKINYVVWSDIFICPYCNEKYVYWDLAIDLKKGLELKSYHCSNCNSLITKRESKRAFNNITDNELKKSFTQFETVPVLINYTWNEKKYQKKPDQKDIDLINDIDKTSIPYWYPTGEFIKGDKTNEFIRLGIQTTNQLYTKRNLYFLAKINDIIEKLDKQYLKSLITAIANRNIFKGNRFVVNNHNPQGRINGPKSGTFYIPSVTVEQNGVELLSYKLSTLSNLFSVKKLGDCYIQTQSISDISNIDDNTIDYIFTDPPFGHNIMYSELNIINENWLKVQTNNFKEAVVSKAQNKDLQDYNELMLLSFKEYFRVLKPSRWITIEFHNTQSAVWNGIQVAVVKAGFVIANVSILDKKSDTINQSYISGAAAKDLVISAFKPSNSFSEKFIKQTGEGLEISFINEFLSNLPKKPAIERTDKMLYSKMLAYYIQRGYEINYDAKSFYKMLKENFVQEDGFWFTTKQIDSYMEYKKQMKLEGMDDIKSGSSLLFVSDEKSALVWLYNFLSEPKTFSEISVAFNQLANIEGDEIPELKEILEQNFITEDGKYRRPQGETEYNTITEKRQRNLKREFETLLVEAQTQKGKIKLVRKEALVYGFELCYKEKRFTDILSVAKKLDKNILENSGELNDFVEAAEIMIEGIS
jgi:DNA modification methylase